MRWLILLGCFLINLSLNLYGEETNAYRIQGQIMDSTSGKALEYCTVSLFSTDSLLVYGTITGADGRYELQAPTPGFYSVQASFVGYTPLNHAILLTEGQNTMVLPVLVLHPGTQHIAAVEITAQNQQQVDYHLDKKIIRFDQELISRSGTVAEALATIPSIQLDTDGNVLLRGSSQYTVLIDSRPTALDASEMLQQLPASSIEHVEIITNPSTYYSPEGTAGIINIILRKNSSNGLGGLINVDGGTYSNYASNLMLSYGLRKISLQVGGNLNRKSTPGTLEQEYRTLGADTLFRNRSEGHFLRSNDLAAVYGIMNWSPGSKTSFSLEGRNGYRKSGYTKEVAYASQLTSGQALLSENRYTGNDERTRSGTYTSLSGNLTQRFATDEQQLQAQFSYTQKNSLEEVNNQLQTKDYELISGQKSTETGPNQAMEGRLNYNQPLVANLQLEVGLHGTQKDTRKNNRIYYRDLQTNTYELQTLLSHQVTYHNYTYAAYGMLKGQKEKFNWQAGIRAEKTNQKVTLKDTTGKFTVSRWDFFPSMHASYQLHEQQKIQLSYSRRLNQPRGYHLEPFYTWTDAYNLRMGNPGLLPEYIHVAELNHQFSTSKITLSSTLFLLHTTQKIEGIQENFNDSVVLSKFQNAGFERESGLEGTLEVRHFTHWKTTFSGHSYYYQTSGSYASSTHPQENFGLSLRWNNTFILGKNCQVQTNASYQSPSIEVQQTRSAIWQLNSALQYSFLQKRITATLQIIDILGTAHQTSEIFASDFYSMQHQKPCAPQVMLNVSWRINNYREATSKENKDSLNKNMDEGME